LTVLNLINLRIPKIEPSFFQTRAQLEIYINLFIENGLIEWAQNMVSMCDILYQANPESYKFIARALYSNGYFDLAITFCKKTLKLFYCDPEAFLILSQCYYLIGDLGEALDCVNRVNAMVEDYFPALLFKQVLKEEIKRRRELKSN
jgi:tetratricopeptide (TPR) repeat protein